MITLVARTDIAELKRFALTMMWLFPLVFMFLLPWLFNHTIPWWPASLSAIMGIIYLSYPAGLYIPYRIWMAIASVLGWVNTRVILFMAFFGLILPIGLLLRLFGKLQYSTRFRTQQLSYWDKRNTPVTKQNLKEPF